MEFHVVIDRIYKLIKSNFMKVYYRYRIIFIGMLVIIVR